MDSMIDFCAFVFEFQSTELVSMFSSALVIGTSVCIEFASSATVAAPMEFNKRNGSI